PKESGIKSFLEDHPKNFLYIKNGIVINDRPLSLYEINKYALMNGSTALETIMGQEPFLALESLAYQFLKSQKKEKHTNNLI
ncbi:MAG: hypothetical protein K8F30_04800, partial [Taibaiella sp.]|nr:hypothetical protein [Taibaiella sp.]